MINLLTLFVIVFLFTASAWSITRVFLLNTLTEKLSVSFLLGSGLGTFLWFLLYLLGVPFTFLSLVLSCCLLAVIGFLLTKVASPNHKMLKENLPRLDRYLLWLALITLLLVFIIGNYNPVTAWDSMAIYDSRAHMIVLNHSLKDITSTSYYLSYPLYVSLLHAAVYFVGGVNPQGLHAFLFVAFLGIIFGRLRSWTNLRFALIGVVLNLFIYELVYHATISYANLAYTVFLASGFFYTVSGDNKTRGRLLILSGLMLGLSTWVRTTEVFWVVGLLVILYSGFRHRLIKFALTSALIFAIFRQSWSSFYQYYEQFFPEPPLAPTALLSRTMLIGIWQYLPQIFSYLLHNVIYPYLEFWGMATGIALISLKYPGKLRALAFIIFGSLFITVAGTAVFSTFFTTWFSIGDSARRMLMFLSPLAMTTAVLALYQIKGKYVR